jgi:ElaB/YqjD/DUF883 family membrane-anchored ribosome-binding protein
MENTKSATGGINGKQEAWDNKVDDMNTQAHSTIDQASETAKPAIDQATSAAHGAADKMSEGANRAKAMLKDRYEQMRGQQEKWADEARIRVRENPMAALGIALAAGFLLRRVLFRSR